MKRLKIVIVNMFLLLTSYIAYSSEYNEQRSASIYYEIEGFNNDGSYGFNCSKYAFIEPDFIDYIYNDPNQDPEVLEFGPGLGRTFEQVYNDDRNNKQNVLYTMVELCPNNREKIKRLYQSLKFKRSPKNKAFIAENNGSEDLNFYTTNSRDRKNNRFDAIASFGLFMYLSPLEQMKLLDFIHDGLKENGQFFIIIDSLFIEFPQIDNSYYTCPKERAREFQENFRIAKDKDPYWPGYFFDKKFTFYTQLVNKTTGRNVPPISYFDGETLSKLLSIYGLEPVKVGEYTQYHTNSTNKSAKNYLGAIYRKKGPKNNQAIQEYENAAKEKEEYMKKFLIYLNTMNLDDL